MEVTQDEPSAPSSKVAELLERKHTRKLDSHVLSTLAARSVDDPFTKVKRMIMELIAHLMATYIRSQWTIIAGAA